MKKTFFTLLLSLLSLGLFLFTSPAVFAQTTTSAANSTTDTSPQALPRNTNLDVPNNLHTYTQSTIIELLSSVICLIAGADPINPNGKCLGIDVETRKIGYVENGGGLLGATGQLIGLTYNIPVSSTHYARSVASNFGITKKTYAQVDVKNDLFCHENPEVCNACIANPSLAYCSGSKNGGGAGIGYLALTPILDLWKVFRNIVYLFFVFVFVLLGLGIMFRIKIDPRTVMTVQNQIPKIIIALILVTLSYAIAGFLIDLMYVGIYLAITLLKTQDLAVYSNIDTNPFFAVGGFGGINGLAGPAAGTIKGTISSLFDGSWGRALSALVGAIIGGLIGGGIAQLPFAKAAGPLVAAGGGGIGGIIGLAMGSKLLGYLAGLIAYIVISIAIITTLFRVWIMLIKAYIYIILDAVFGPFWIALGLINSGAGFGSWIRKLLANLAAFPTVLILFMLGRIVQHGFEQDSVGNFVPPLIGDPGNVSAMGSIIGLGIILIAPEAVNITKSIFKAPEMKYTAAIGRALGAASGAAQFGPKKAWEGLTAWNPATGKGGPLSMKIASMTDSKKKSFLRTIIGMKH